MTDQAVETYWSIRFAQCQEALERNCFTVHLAEDRGHAHDLVMNEIVPAIKPLSVSWGGSKTLEATGLLDTLRERSDIVCIGVAREGLSREELFASRIESFLADLYLSSTNALTAAGQLVNLDMWGNRVAAMAFGPRHVIIIAGRNKLVPDIPRAIARIRELAAPLNTIRHGIERGECRAPCQKAARCVDCVSEKRICNTWTITEKAYPAGRTHVVLVNEDLGY